jgi:hypothetical protein
LSYRTAKKAEHPVREVFKYRANPAYIPMIKAVAAGKWPVNVLAGVSRFYSRNG